MNTSFRAPCVRMHAILLVVASFSKQDNYLKHRFKHIQHWFSRRHVTLLDWPSQFPDLNIIEGVWADLERRLVGRNARNADEKFSQLEEEWKKISLSSIQTLLDFI
ncbi:Transposable element Tc1 transposase [Araneus ventricosus]|uniref:Transposable element Tc1 transposase n=1 Tax=Araneus ventricosus TaxID=182803 RepID=A0A4Y2AC84_ARAVE|nr:Transposable element Tc1 transposase [Araneus ventricosus]